MSETPASAYRKQMLAKRHTEAILDQMERIENEPRIWIRSMLIEELESMKRSIADLLADQKGEEK